MTAGRRDGRARWQRSGPPDAALRVLDERLARGEISPHDYARRRSVLAGSSRPSQHPHSRQWLPLALAALIAAGAVLAGLAFVLPGGWRAPGTSACAPASLPGSVVTVTLTDMGAMMGGQGHGMMRIIARPASVPAGTVSFRAVNTGTVTHELVVLPLAPGQPAGSRPVGPDRTVSEAGSLGEASATCAAGHGEGIAPGASGWVTLHLRPGRYELICNLPGHYASGMHTGLSTR